MARHSWRKDSEGHKETCQRCGMQHRKGARRGANRMHPYYSVHEYRRRGGTSWFWVQKKDPVPPCHPHRPGASSARRP